MKNKRYENDLREALICERRDQNINLYFATSLAAIVIAAAVLRFYNLGRPPIWFDEAFTLQVSRQPLSVILFNEVDNHPPLFYLIEHLWLAITPNLALLRVPAALAGVAAVAIAGLAARDLVSPRAGLLAAAILGVSTGHIYMSQDARMYTLVTLGLTLAAWGLTGWASEKIPNRVYAPLYVVGAGVAIYAHVVGLICLAAMNLGLLSHFFFVDRAPMRRYQRWLVLNLFVLVIALPWLAVLGTATASFPGIGANPTRLLPWLLINMVGYPGLPDGLRIVANLLVLSTILAGLFGLRRARVHALVVVTGSMLIIFPVLMALINLKLPIFANRVFLPCSIAAAILVSATIDRLSSGLRFWAWAGLLLALGAGSALIELKRPVKNEDVPQALALAARQGFGNAVIITDAFFTAGTVRVLAPERQTYQQMGNRFIRVDHNFDRIYAQGIAKVRRMDAVQLNRAVNNGILVPDIRNELARTNKIIYLSDFGNFDTEFLNYLNFRKVASPNLTQPRRIILERTWTQVQLWERKSLI
jgi:uncharacterized membrane protein